MLQVIATFLQQFKRMEEFRMCTVEAQAATEDLREEMETVICNFNSRHEKVTSDQFKNVDHLIYLCFVNS